MALNNDFFRINFPYGMCKNVANEWHVFNREYMPLGCNNTCSTTYFRSQAPDYYAKYKGLTDNVLESLIKDPTRIQRDPEGRIDSVFFYSDRTNPQSNPEYWSDYFEIIQSLSAFHIDNASRTIRFRPLTKRPLTLD